LKPPDAHLPDIRTDKSRFLVKINFMKIKGFILPLLISMSSHYVFAQIKWSTTAKPADQVAWDNYSTSYIGALKDSLPFVITAIPYNGIYSNSADINTPLDLSFEGSLFRFRSTVSDRSRKLYTYDSSEVYFLAAGIYKRNAAGYEYRVLLNARTIIIPWSPISRFSNLDLNVFGEGCGYLGGFKTTWGNYIIVELRKRGADSSLSSAIVYWKETKPRISSIYTSKNLNEFFILLKRPWDKTQTSSIPLKNPVFPSTENSIIYYLSADIYNRNAVEYQLIKDGTVIQQWKPNDFDINFIWLKELSPGKYTLEIRYSRQRQNVSDYDFEIRPAWHQTAAFKLTAGSLVAAFFGFIFLMFRYKSDQKKVETERAGRERLQLELNTIYSQLNPHFIFNCLSSIQGLVNKNDIQAANLYLSEFGDLLRNSLTIAGKDFNTLSHEIETLTSYLKLEQLRFSFAYSITVDTNIDLVETTIPSLLLQPLVENAVKHGVSGMQHAGKIEINLLRENADMKVVIRDNGKGISPGPPANGYGLRLTRQRIGLLNAILKDRTLGLTLQERVSLGTEIHVLFKNWLL
jgi:two-component system LytT family sensor kinase